MTGIEGKLRDVDANMKQPDEGLTAERLGADEIARLGDIIRRLRGGLVTIAALCPFPPHPDKLSTRMAEIAKKTLKDEVRR